MDSRMRTTIPYGSNKVFGLKIPQNISNRYTKKAGEYNGLNVITITTKMRILDWVY